MSEQNIATSDGSKPYSDIVNEQRIRDAMCGHAPKVVGDEYEPPKTTDLTEAMEKFPRYETAPRKDA